MNTGGEMWSLNKDSLRVLTAHSQNTYSISQSKIIKFFQVIMFIYEL